MGLFSGLFSKKEKKRYCLLCGKELTGDTCQFCGREDKPLVPLSALNWSKVSVAELDSMCGPIEPCKQLSATREMAEAGELNIADIYVDKLVEAEDDDDDDGLFDFKSVETLNVYIQFSTPDLAPCDTECLITPLNNERMEELLKNGRHDAKILWGRKKKSDYYLTFVPQSDDMAAVFDKEMIEDFIDLGADTQERTLPPEGGEYRSYV